MSKQQKQKQPIKSKEPRVSREAVTLAKIPQNPKPKPKPASSSSAYDRHFGRNNTTRSAVDFLTSTAKLVASIAPSVASMAPYLLATHPPSQLNAVSNGGASHLAVANSAYNVTSAQPQVAGLATGNPFANSVGINNMKPITKKGMLHGARIVGLDKLADIQTTDPVTGLAYGEGDLIKAIDLNPTGPAYAGTSLQQQARIYNRYKIHNLVIVYVPSCPATTYGSNILSCTPDPDSPYVSDGIAGTQLATAVEGAETFQTWQAGMTAWPGDRSQNFYSRPSITDLRFVSPGIVNLICNSPANVTIILGSLYVAYDIEFTERSLEQVADQNVFSIDYPLASVPSGTNNFLPLGTPQGQNGLAQVRTDQIIGSELAAPPLPDQHGTMPLKYIADVNGFGCLCNLPVGLLQYGVVYTGTTCTSSTATMGVYKTENGISSAGSSTLTKFAYGGNATAGVYIEWGVFKCTYQSVDGNANRVRLSLGTFTSPSDVVIWISKGFDQTPENSLGVSAMFSSMQRKLQALESSMLALKSSQPDDSAEKLQTCVSTHGAPVSTPQLSKLFSLGEIVGSSDVVGQHFLWLNQTEQAQSSVPYVFVVYSFPKRAPGDTQTDDLRWRTVSIPESIADKRDSDLARKRNYEFAHLIWSEVRSRTKPGLTTSPQ